MDLIAPLSADQLYHAFDPAQLPFETTAELETNFQPLGQERAAGAIAFGIGMQQQGYNLFALGPNGIGRKSTVIGQLEERAAALPTPDDWCYVYNFDMPHKPVARRLPPGRAVALRDDMKVLINELASVLPAALTSEEYQIQRRAIEEEFRGLHTEALEKLREEAQQRGIALIQTPAGFAFAPLRDNSEVITPDEFMRLEAGEQKRIEETVVTLQEELQRIMRQLPNLQRQLQSRLRQLNQSVVDFAITPLLSELRSKYSDLTEIVAYIDAVQKDIIENYEAFVQEGDDEGRQVLGAALGIASAGGKTLLSRYEVNVVIDNSDRSGAPVIYLDQPRYPNLIGRVEHVAQMGALVTDFTLIKPGALHVANGGYLLVEAAKLLTEPLSWEALKQALRTRAIRIESLGQAYSLVSTVSLEPEPIPLSVKVVLIGERLLYYLLSSYDPEFGELFKVAADFADEVERDSESAHHYARIVARLSKQEGLHAFDRDAVARVIEHGSRMVDDADKLSLHMESIADVVREANHWAVQAGHERVTRDDVQRAIDMQIYRSSRIHERMQETILRGHILIDTEGDVVGQVNGLSVYSLGNQSFGRPSRITARVRMGKGEVIDIERQVDLGGPIHSKGVMILSGYLGMTYAAERPLSLSATLVFEQSYGGVEGDSASSAELYALLSALAEAPIRQTLAVTGSVNQMGQVQAIGGVNEKIEGFFDICKARGLTGEQGVLIPAANVRNLMLRNDVVEAAVQGHFHIYPVSHVTEGIALLTGIPAGSADTNGEYPPETIGGRVVARLKQFAEKQREQAASSSAGIRADEAVPGEG